MHSILVCHRIQIIGINMRLSICNKVMTIVNDLYSLYIHIYMYMWGYNIQLMDVWDLVDVPKLKRINRIGKARKRVYQNGMTRFANVQHGTTLHRYMSPGTVTLQCQLLLPRGKHWCSMLFLKLAYTVQCPGISVTSFLN